MYFDSIWLNIKKKLSKAALVILFFLVIVEISGIDSGRFNMTIHNDM